MRTILFITILLFNISFSLAQSLKIELGQKIGYGPFQPDATTVLFHPPQTHPLFNTFSKLEFNNIPKDLIEVKKGIIPFDFLQFLYQNLRNTENFKLYEDFKKQRSYTIADEELSTENIDCFVKIIYAKNSENKAICIIDANQNGDFNDDMRFNIEDIHSLEELKTNNHKVIETAYQYSNGKNIINKILPVIVFTHNNALKYSIPTYMVGQLTNEEKIYVSHEFRFPDYWVSNININEGNTFIKKQDIFEWNNKFFKNNGVDIRSNTLHLTEETTGDQKFTLANLVQPDIKTNQIINLKEYKGKYIFIDFWGSWCAPCLQQLPTMATIYKEIDSSKIDFIGIAGRDSYKNALKVINNQSILWKNILSDETNNLVDIFNITAYPTGVLIDPTGKIIENNISIIELRPYLRKYNLLKQ